MADGHGRTALAVSTTKNHLAVAKVLLDSMLGKVADWYEQEVDDAVDALTSLLEPLIMAVLGVIIGGLVVAMYLPIFKMGQVV